MKKILAINYSQTGQLHDIVDNFIAPLEHFEIDRVKFQPKNPISFPWEIHEFYNFMPETVNEEPVELAPLHFKHEKYDLIILGYQPWFLSPSLPTTSLLKSEPFKNVLRNTPVVTIIGARNMWLNSQTSVVHLLQEAGAKIVGNVAFVDRAPNHLSAASIAHWMVSGKKTRKWGILPLPGVSDEDIQGAGKYGKLVADALDTTTLDTLQDAIIAHGGLRINTHILFIEGKAKKIFRIWTRLIKKKESQGKNRSFWIKFFRVYLNVALYGVAPILLLFYNILIRPFTIKKIRAKKQYFAYLGMQKK